MNRIFKDKALVYKGDSVQLHIGRYAEPRERVALQLMYEDKEMGVLVPYMTCSVNLPNEPCPPGEVWIKDYSENEGCADWLIANGVIEPYPWASVPSGWVMIQRYRLTKEVLEELK